MFVSADKKPRQFKGHILIVPAISVGNVAQLAADLLISTLCMHRCGFIQHSSILPLVGGDPFAHPDATSCKIVTCCEVFESVEHQVLIIQQRAPFVKGRRGLFRKWLVEWIKEQNFKRVVIATSSSAHERLDSQLEGPQFRFVASPHIEKEFGEMFRDFYEWTELEKRQSFPAPSVLEENGDNKGELYIPGGGIAKSLYQDLCSDVPVVVFLMFCAEGDNAVEAIELANRLNRWLSLIMFHGDNAVEAIELANRLNRWLSLIMFHSRSIVDASEGAIIKYSQWKVPTSWKLFYGSKFDQTLFH